MKKKMFYKLDIFIILSLVLFILLDTFVISRSYAEVADSHIENNNKQLSLSSNETVIEENYYEDENIKIEINEYEYLDTTIYVADVKVSSIDYLYSAFANNEYGKNITDEVSDIAESKNAILAINGDYYGARNSGYVFRNGILYRSSVASNSQEDLLINSDGTFTIMNENQISEEILEENNVLQVYSFGPALINDYEIAVSLNEEVGKAKASNPRTAICEIEPLHYLFVVSDGRTDESEGLSLYELASFLKDFDVKVAYNLDGGGSSTMVFNNQLINNPTTSGKSIKERSVSDAICIGY